MKISLRKALWSLWFMGVVLLLMVMMVGGCAHEQNFITDGYRTGVVSHTAYDTALSVMGDLYKQGKIGEEEKEKAILLGGVWKKAHNNAMTALANYVDSGAVTDKEKYLAAMDQAAKALADLLAYVNPILTENGVKAIEVRE